MSRASSKTKPANAKGGILKFVDTETLKTNLDAPTEEELRQEALDSREISGSVTESRTNRSRRMAVLQQMGYDLKHVDDFEPHPDNFFSLDQESIDNLAASIQETGHTDPIQYRTRPGQKDQIIAGERRWRAHKKLWELTRDERWAMIPCKNLGALDDQEAMFQLASDNLNQRVLTPSELARCIDLAGERLAQRRRQDPSFNEKYKGKRTRQIIAEMFKISDASVGRYVAINKKLSEEGKQLLDDGKITRTQALAISNMDPSDQELVLQHISDSNIEGAEIDKLIASGGDNENQEDTGTQKRKEKTMDSLLKNARNSLKKASRFEDRPSAAILGEIKDLLYEIEGRLER